MYVLAARSFGDLVDQMQLLQRRSSTDSSLVSEITKYRGQVTHEAKQLTVQKNRLKRERGQAQAAKIAALHSLNAEKQYQANLSGKIQHLIAQAQAAAAAARLPQRPVPAARPAPTPAPRRPPARWAARPSRSRAVPGHAVRVGRREPRRVRLLRPDMYVYAQLGVSLPHNAAAQYGWAPRCRASDLQPGDLVFFDGLGHVGIYVGGGTFIHAPHTGTSSSSARCPAGTPIRRRARVLG